MKSLKLAVAVALVVGTTSAVAATVSVAEGDDLAAKVEEARSLAIAGDDTALDEAFTYCCLPGFSLGGVGCLTDDPQLDGFVPNANVVGGKGRKAPWMKTAKDLVGRRRLIGGKVDIGCYETDFTYGLMLLVK